jgi:hypothetical protein
VLPVNGITTGTINWQTFSHLSFAFRITPDLLLLGIGFALVMGVVGGVPPAIRAGTRQRRPDDSRDVGTPTNTKVAKITKVTKPIGVQP